MEDPGFREEYARIYGEYALIEALVRAPRGGEAGAGRNRPASRHNPVRGRGAGGRLGGDNSLVRALGLVPSIALGMARGRPDRQVVVIDDDGWGKRSGQSVPATTLAM